MLTRTPAKYLVPRILPLRQGVIDQLLGHVPPENVSNLDQQDLGQQHAGLGERQLRHGRDVHGLLEQDRWRAGSEGEREETQAGVTNAKKDQYRIYCIRALGQDGETYIYKAENSREKKGK